jgi:hypothetical protein
VVGQVFDVVTVAIAVVALLGLAVFLARPDRARADEEDARDFFDAHGHWPDESAPVEASEPGLAERPSG